MVRPRPQQDVLLRITPKQSAESLPIAVPQLLAGPASTQCAWDQLGHYPPSRWIENDDRIRARPDDLLDAAVVTVDHPRVAGRGGIDPASELLVVQADPPRLVEDRVEFDVRRAEASGQGSSDGSLPGTGNTNHRYPTHDRAIYAEPAGQQSQLVRVQAQLYR